MAPPRAAAKRKRALKPAVKDLGVTLGLDKPVTRYNKQRKNKCDEDDLVEQRYREEIHRLNQIEMVMRESNVSQELGSDAEDEAVDEDSCGDLSEDEDGVCPKPVPKRGRKQTRKVEIAPETVKEMCNMITQSTRKSLITKRCAQEADSQNPSSEVEHKEEEDSKTESVPQEMIMYRRFRQILGQQIEWFNKRKSADTSTIDDYCKELVTYHFSSSRVSLHRQVYYEHLSWLAIACGEAMTIGVENIRIAEYGLLAWLPSFQAGYSQRYFELNDDGSPTSNTNLNLLLRNACLKAERRIRDVNTELLEARSALADLITHVTKVYYEKRTICTEFESVHENLARGNPRFDESSVYGLKPIRLALEPPYFKSEDGLMAYPMTPDVVRRVDNYMHCFFKRDKQKWTTKDLHQLKACIKETLFNRRLSALNDRYETLMTDCLHRYEEELGSDGKVGGLAAAELNRKRRGRPKKSELEYSSQHGIIYPVIGKLPNGTIIRIQVTPRLLAEWRTNEEKNLKTKSYEELVYMENEVIDWETVANKMVVKSRKHRSAEDCELAWRHEVHPSVDDKRWGVEEGRQLKEIYSRLKTDWCEISRSLNQSTDATLRPGRTPYQCFFRVRNRVDPPKKLTWTKELDDQVLSKLKDYPGNWRLVAASIDDPAATKRQVIERYKKTINPVLRNGAFTRVEDCLLILTIEKLKPFLAREGHFGCLLAYLPWRCETTWRDRANNLFSDWIVPWTLEEDKMLLKLAKTMNRNWQKISEEFTSFKNRKGCLTRYKILMRRLKDPRFNNSLEAYHEAYAMTRYNVFQYKHLKEILQLLTRVKANPLPKEHMNFPGLLRDQEPTEVRLQHMLLTFDKDILDSAIKSLTRYVQTRDNYWRNWISKHGKRKRTFDRRTFHAENPQSVASALHIRGLELRPKDEFSNLTDFENEIYKFYGRFKRTKALKQTAERPYIPDAKTLAQWYVVSRLVATSVDELDEVPIKRKWKSLKSDEDFEALSVAKRKKLTKSTTLTAGKPRGRQKKVETHTESKLATLARKHITVARKHITMKATGMMTSRTRTLRGKKAKVTPVVNEEGYLLIPPEPPLRSIKRRQSKRNEDPEFLCKDEKVMGSVVENTSGKRRSARVPKRIVRDDSFYEGDNIPDDDA